MRQKQRLPPSHVVHLLEAVEQKSTREMMKNVTTPARGENAVERFDRYLETFRAVVRAYVETRERAPIAAFEIDPDAVSMSKRLTIDGIHHMADIEIATTKALVDEPELQRAWFALALGEPVEPKLERRVVERCGPIYTARGLAPWIYYKPSRRLA
jgi:hypothetical protein